MNTEISTAVDGSSEAQAREYCKRRGLHATYDSGYKFAFSGFKAGFEAAVQSYISKLTPEEILRLVPHSKRIEMLPTYLSGCNLELVYSTLQNKVETIIRGSGGYRIIIGAKPCLRKLHWKHGSATLCSTSKIVPRGTQLKYTDDIRNVTCNICQAKLAEKVDDGSLLGELRDQFAEQYAVVKQRLAARRGH